MEILLFLGVPILRHFRLALIAVDPILKDHVCPQKLLPEKMVAVPIPHIRLYAQELFHLIFWVFFAA